MEYTLTRQDSAGTYHHLLVLVGMTGSGKSTVAQYLQHRGWHAIRFGEMTMRVLASRNLPINEENERNVREELRATHGMDAYAKLWLPDIVKALATGPTVIDGLYSWAEYKFLRQQFNRQMKLVALLATRSVRYARLAGRAERPLSCEEAESRDFAEIENVEKAGPIAMADYIILNDGSENELNRGVDDLMSTHFGGFGDSCSPAAGMEQ